MYSFILNHPFEHVKTILNDTVTSNATDGVFAIISKLLTILKRKLQDQ